MRATTLGIIRILMWAKVPRDSPLLMIRSIILNDWVSQMIPVRPTVNSARGPRCCMKIYRDKEFMTSL
jgi:hypothetical protein